MSDDLRQDYFDRVNAMAARFLTERRGRRETIRERIARLLGRQPALSVAPRHRISGPREHVIGCVGCGELLFGWRQDMGLPRCSDCKANDGPRVA